MVTVIIIVEVMGRPADYASKAIREHIKKLDKVKGVDVIKKEFSEPKLLDDEKQLYTCFCEVEFRCENLSQLVDITFDFMPSSLEITDPPKVSLDASEATSLLNGISGRLHRYDDIVKIVQNKEKAMINEIKVARQIMLEHNLIDENGKILVEIKDRKKKDDKKEDKKD